MRMQEFLEKDKEAIIAAVSGAPDNETAAREADRRLTKILYAFNDAEESESVKRAAYDMVQTARSACLLIDTGGETRVWGRTSYTEEKRKTSKLFIVLLIAGIAAVAAGVLLFAAAEGALKSLYTQTPVLILLIAGIALTFFAGLRVKPAPRKGKEELFGETRADGARVYRALLATVLSIDKRLDEVRNNERIELRKQLRENQDGVDSAQIDMLSSLLEDAYTEKESVYAQEMISHIKYYLHTHKIEALDYSARDAAMFDMMPSSTARTLRPALVQDGKLLKKGLATGGR